jgi:hypothetical protein
VSAADEWRQHVLKERRRFRLGTEAHHKLGDLSRDAEDWFYYT